MELPSTESTKKWHCWKGENWNIILRFHSNGFCCSCKLNISKILVLLAFQLNALPHMFIIDGIGNFFTSERKGYKKNLCKSQKEKAIHESRTLVVSGGFFCNIFVSNADIEYSCAVPHLNKIIFSKKHHFLNPSTGLIRNHIRLQAKPPSQIKLYMLETYT